MGESALESGRTPGVWCPGNQVKGLFSGGEKNAL